MNEVLLRTKMILKFRPWSLQWKHRSSSKGSPQKVPAQGVVVSKSTGTVGAVFAGMIITDWSNTDNRSCFNLCISSLIK